MGFPRLVRSVSRTPSPSTFWSRLAAATTILLAASFACAATLPDPVDDATISPFHNVGFMRGPGRIATGFIASHRAVAVTAAHFFYSESGFVDVPDGTAYWVAPRGKVRPTSETYTLLRTHVVYTGAGGYAAMVQQSGANSFQAFNQDLAIAYGYENLVDHAPLEVEADSLQRLESNRNKRIIGNAQSFYQDRLRPSDSPDVELLHATGTNDTRFGTLINAYPYYLALKNATLNNTKLIVAPGGSGSPLLVQENSTTWMVAGVCVAAPDDLLLTPDGVPPEYAGLAAVRAFRTEDVTALITPLLASFNAAPTFLVDLPASGSAIVGDNVLLEVQVDGWNPITLQWYRNGVSLGAIGQSNQLSLFNITGDQAGTYSVRATNPNGTTVSRNHVLTVTQSPVITSHPVSQTIPYGNNTPFSCAFRGEAPFTVQWYRDDVPLAGGTAATYYVGSATFAQEGTYRARVTNAFGEAWTNPATLSVTMSQSFVGTISPGTSAPGPGDKVLLAPTGAREPDTRFQWLLNGSPIPGATDRVLALGRVGPADFGSYSLQVTHPRGSVTSSPYALAPGSSTVAFTDPPLVRRVEEGATIRLARQLFASAVISYQWLKDDAPVTGATSATLDLGPITAALAGDYALRATTTAGTVTSEPITVQIDPHAFWRELSLRAPAPAVSGGLAGGEVFFFGERWHTHFPAGAGAPDVRTSYSPGQVRDLVSGNGILAAVTDLNGTGTPVTISRDGGDTWQSVTGAGFTPAGLAFGQGRFLTGSIERNALNAPLSTMLSDDGEHWVATTTQWPGGTEPIYWQTREITSGLGTFVVAGVDGALLASPDGTSWTITRAAGISQPAEAIAFDGTRFVGTYAGPFVIVSNDGQTWTTQPLVAASTYTPVELVGGDGWFAALSESRQVALSRNGTDWELQPADDYEVAHLVGIGGGHLYALRADGVPLVSRALGSLVLVREPASTFRVTGRNGVLSVDARGDVDDNVTYQWFSGESGDTSSPIAGATTATLTLPPAGSELTAWVRVTEDGVSRDSATGRLRNFAPGHFFSDNGQDRVAAVLRADGTITWMGHDTVTGNFHHLRRRPLFAAAATPVRGNVESDYLARHSTDYDYTRVDGATSVDLLFAGVDPFALFNDSTRVTGSRPTGYFRGGIPARTAAELDALCLPDGRVVFGLHTPDTVLAGDAVAATNGQVDFDFGTSGQVHLAFDHTSGRFSGTWTRDAGATVENLRGAREGADGNILLANLSGRAWLPAANEVTIGGFVVQGTGQLRVLARGIGPSLLGYGVTDAAAAPTLRLYAGSNLLLENTRWSTDPRMNEIIDVGARVGAFAIDPDEADSAVLAEVSQGAYTFHVFDPTGSGTALAELYFDRDFSGNGRLVNVSTRGWVDDAGAVVIAGFSITGDAPRQVLLRGVGPTLAGLGVGDAAQGVEIELYRLATSLLRKSGWTQLDVPVSTYGATGEPYMRAVMDAVGAFPLAFNPDGDNGDAALLVWLEAGSYTVVVRNAAGTGGTALAEVYDVPFDAAR